MPIQLDRILVRNFKSFKGNVAIGPMKRFTTITGPNGCGKSNLMDALSFAMGEKTIKLRVKQLKELIYGANIGKPVFDGTQVTVVFILEDGTNKSFTRRIVGTSSEYKINEQVVLLEPYTSELKQLGINVKDRNFLIFQGTVESIAMKGPKELTAILEQISTSIELKAEYESLKSEVRRLENKVDSMFKTKQIHRAQKQQALLEKKEADRYNELHNKYVTLKSELYLFELFHIEMDIDNLKETLNSKDQELSQYTIDKELALQLSKKKKEQMQVLLDRLQNMEEDLSKMEGAFKKKGTTLTVVKEKISYLQNTLNTANSSLAHAQRSYNVHINTLQELKDDLMKVQSMLEEFDENMAMQSLSQSSIDLDNTKVDEYFRLKQISDKISMEDIKVCNSLKSEQREAQNKLDDETRQKAELETEIRRQNLSKDEIEKRIAILRQSIHETEEILINESNAKHSLEDTISNHGNKIESVQIQLEKVSKELENVKIDNYMSARLKKKAESIRILQDIFPDVYGRVHTLCKPIHPRYNIAVTKVFGSHMESIIVAKNKVAIECIAYLREQEIDVETFLPLDSLKTVPLQDRLRHISEPSGTKLLYDVLNFTPKEINNAILFLTKNTLVCDTMDDANIVAYQMNPHCTYDCVALDGTFFRKNGIFSGGGSELSTRAKLWEAKQLFELKSKKVALVEELRKVPNLEQLKSAMNLTHIKVNAIKTRLKYIKHDLREKEKQLAALQEQLEIAKNKLQLKFNIITSIKETMKKRDHDIEVIETRISNVENDIFKKFCRSTGLHCIQQYKRQNLRKYYEQAERRLELDQQYDRIKNLLEFEAARDTKGDILKYENIVRRTEAELHKLRKKEGSCKIDIENMEHDLNQLRAMCKETTINVAEQEKILKECRGQISIIAKSIRRAQMERTIILTNIEKRKAQWREILKTSKVEDINIPFNFEDSHNGFLLNETTPSAEDSGDFQLFPRVDFSGLSEDMKSRVEEDMNNARIELTSAIAEIEEEMKHVKVPNLKAAEKLSLIKEQLKNADTIFQETRKKVSLVQSKFEKAKYERYQRFMCCFEYISGKIDDIYKSLHNDPSAQAMIILESPEEPYLGGIEYSCIVPKKRFQPMSNLSGGEKTLAALALLFAIHSFKTAPFIMMDEIDASLDNVNIKNFLRFVRSKQNDMQFVVISLKPKLCMHADYVLGITSNRNEESPVSEVFSFDFSTYSMPNK